MTTATYTVRLKNTGRSGDDLVSKERADGFLEKMKSWHDEQLDQVAHAQYGGAKAVEKEPGLYALSIACGRESLKMLSHYFDDLGIAHLTAADGQQFRKPIFDQAARKKIVLPKAPKPPQKGRGEAPPS